MCHLKQGRGSVPSSCIEFLPSTVWKEDPATGEPEDRRSLDTQLNVWGRSASGTARPTLDGATGNRLLLSQARWVRFCLQQQRTQLDRRFTDVGGKTDTAHESEGTTVHPLPLPHSAVCPVTSTGLVSHAPKQLKNKTKWEKYTNLVL